MHDSRYGMGLVQWTAIAAGVVAYGTAGCASSASSDASATSPDAESPDAFDAAPDVGLAVDAPATVDASDAARASDAGDREDASDAGDARDAGWSCNGINPRSMGAMGDGLTDDTAAIQAALDAAAKGQGGGVVCVDDGTYMIRAFDAVTGKTQGVSVGSNVTLSMSPGATLRAFPNASEWYRIVYVDHQSNVRIEGGTVQGERDQHTGTTGEWGHGVSILGSTNVTVSGVTSRDCWGDGFVIGPDAETLMIMSSQITFENVVADNNRRQGLSIVGCTGANIEGSSFINTHGTAPQYGIDMEPGPPAVVQNVTVSHCTFTNDVGAGVGISGGTSNTVTDSTFTGSGIGVELELPATKNNKFTGNTLTGNHGAGIWVREGATQNLFQNNVVTLTFRYGIWLSGGTLGGANANTFLDNHVSASSQFTNLASPNIQIDQAASNNELQGNTVRAGAGPNLPSYGLVIATPDCQGNQIIGNDLKMSGAEGAISNGGTGTVITGNSM